MVLPWGTWHYDGAPAYKAPALSCCPLAGSHRLRQEGLRRFRVVPTRLFQSGRSCANRRLWTGFVNRHPRSPFRCRVRIRRSPEIQCRRSSIRCPFGPDGRQFIRLGQASLAVRLLKSTLNPEVMDGQNVRPSEVENQEHLGSPPPDALALGQAFSVARRRLKSSASFTSRQSGTPNPSATE